MSESPRDARGYTLLVNAIRSIMSTNELAELRAFACEQYAGDDRLEELEAMIEVRAFELLAESREYDSPQLRLLDESS